jgi:DNA topoisomerase-2
MQLVNGGKGIGTGFSTDILNYNPLTIIDDVKQRLLLGDNGDDGDDGEEKVQPPLTQLKPYYNGFKGTITSLNDQNNKYLIKGVYEILSDKQVRVTELPIGTWTDDYKKYIEDLIDFKPISQTQDKDKKDKDKKAPKKSKSDQPQIKDYIDMSTDTVVDFTITFTSGVIAELKDAIVEHSTCSALEKLLKLYTTRSSTNMHVFDENEKLIKCEKVDDVITHFMKVREAYYIKRKKYQVDALKKDLCVLSNKARFISEVLDDTIDLRKKKSAEVSEIMKNQKYDMIDEDEQYKYLVRLPMDSVTEENVEKIMSERDRKNKEFEILSTTTEKEIWLKELETLRGEYVKIREKAQKEEKNNELSSSSNVKSKVKTIKKSVKKNV